MEKGPRLGRGRTAEVFGWKDNLILKLFFDSTPDTWAQQEAQITRVAYEFGLPVPAVEGVIEIDGRNGILFERIDGPSMLTETKSKPWKLFRSALVLAELHAAIHKCIGPDLPSQRHQLEDAIRNAKALPENMKEAALKVLDHLPDGNALCHGDFHPDNVMVSSRGPIIIDWIIATQGNPLADAARTSLLLRLGDPPPGTRGRWLINSGRGLYHSTYLKLNFPTYFSYN